MLDWGDEKSADKWQAIYIKVKEQTSKVLKTELGMETTIQIAMTLTLLFFQRSETRVEQGLEKIFDSKTPLLGLPVIALIIFSTIWSLKAAWTSYIRGISFKKDYFPITSKISIGFYVLISTYIKTSVMILFLAPGLGLFNLLRHYQGELLPYKVIADPPTYTSDSGEVYTFPKINTDEDLMYYSTAEPIAWNKITRFDYTDLKNPKKPPLSIYTVFSTNEYLTLFWILIFLQPILVWFVKKYSNPGPFSRQTWLESIINAMENSQIPSPMEDFEELSGSVADHIERHGKINKEMKLTILANFFHHLLMLAPIYILCKLLIIILPI